VRELLWLMRARFASGAGGVAINIPPRLDSVSPSSGSMAGGTTLTLTGNSFDGRPLLVTVGGSQATSVTRVSATQATCVTPSGVAGVVDVAITTPGGTASRAGAFTYFASAPTVTSVSPPTGTSLGGTAVTITGTAFTGATSVTFGGVAATSIIVVGPTTITCVTPAGTPSAAVAVAVTTPGGTGTLPSGYTYNALPTVTSVVNAISTSVGDIAGGYTVTITGTRLTGTSSVTFGGTAATGIVVVGPTTVTCTVPAKPAGTYTVQITATDGTASLASAFEYWSPAQLSLSGWWRGSYTAPGADPRWTGTASAGGSGGRDLIAAVVTPPGAGAAVNGFTPADFVPATPNGLDTNDPASSFLAVSAYSGWALVYFDAITANSATAYQNDVIVNSSTGGYMGVTARSSGLVYMYQYDGGFPQAQAAVTAGAWQLVHFKYDGANMKIGVNGTWGSPVAAGNIAVGLGGEKLRFGQYASGGTFPMDGRALEYGFAASALSDGDLATKMRGYAATRYGVSV